tara:strand:- start:388 stop:837 length:450 start_codon:yes stop_codon:yes gene_type:complete
MVWIALSVILVSIIVFPKKFAILTTIIVAGVVGIIEWQSNQSNNPVDPVEISFSYDPSICSEEYPLFVTIKNIGDRTLSKVEYQIEGRRKGYSTNVLKSRLSYQRNFSDKILNPGESYTQCVRLLLKTEYASIDPKTLEYNAYSVTPWY